MIKLLTIFLLCTGIARGEYPSDRVVNVIVAVPPGGGTDAMTRLVLHHAGAMLSTRFVVKNYKGAGGQAGYTVLSRSKPDGYTMGTITTMSIVTHELTRKKVAYRLQESFVPVAQVMKVPSGLYANAKSRFRSVEELFEYAKKNPGKLTCSGSSLYGAHHIQLKLLEMKSGIKFTYVPFDGGAGARNALLGSHTDLAAGGISEYQSLIKAGKVIPMVIAAESRLPAFPEIPVYRDLGYDVQVGPSRGFAVPKGTPPEKVRLLSETVRKVLQDPAFLSDAERMGIKPYLEYLNADEFRDLLAGLSRVMRQVLKE